MLDALTQLLLGAFEQGGGVAPAVPVLARLEQQHLADSTGEVGQSGVRGLPHPVEAQGALGVRGIEKFRHRVPALGDPQVAPAEVEAGHRQILRGALDRSFEGGGGPAEQGYPIVGIRKDCGPHQALAEVVEGREGVRVDRSGRPVGVGSPLEVGPCVLSRCREDHPSAAAEDPQGVEVAVAAVGLVDPGEGLEAGIAGGQGGLPVSGRQPLGAAGVDERDLEPGRRRVVCQLGCSGGGVQCEVELLSRVL
jgi:hypothetical protein